jgi:hypothetical protein
MDSEAERMPCASVAAEALAVAVVDPLDDSNSFCRSPSKQVRPKDLVTSRERAGLACPHASKPKNRGATQREEKSLGTFLAGSPIA